MQQSASQYWSIDVRNEQIDKFHTIWLGERSYFQNIFLKIRLRFANTRDMRAF